MRKANSDTTVKGNRPSYLKLIESCELEKRWKALWSRMESCDFCPRDCKSNRLQGEIGVCGADANLKIASFHPHFGEEKELVGKNGSGTIFFSGCAMHCVFCINYEISNWNTGIYRTIDEFAEMMLAVQKLGCHNLNLVTPTHYLPHILRALEIAAKNGLTIPVVYNTHSYEKTEIIRMLNDVVDIYLPDIKYANSVLASNYSSGAADYPEISQKALLEMNKQTGTAIPNPVTGLIHRGVMIRHLVMPNHVENSRKVLTWISENLPKNSYVNIMSQYRPDYIAEKFEKISRSITLDEYSEVVSIARSLGLTNLRLQG